MQRWIRFVCEGIGLIAGYSAVLLLGLAVASMQLANLVDPRGVPRAPKANFPGVRPPTEAERALRLPLATGTSLAATWRRQRGRSPVPAETTLRSNSPTRTSRRGKPSSMPPGMTASHRPRQMPRGSTNTTPSTPGSSPNPSLFASCARSATSVPEIDPEFVPW